MRADDIPGIDQLTLEEKILLMEDLWDKIAADEFRLPIPHSHIQELDRRLRRFESLPDSLLSLDDLKARTRTRK